MLDTKHFGGRVPPKGDRFEDDEIRWTDETRGLELSSLVLPDKLDMGMLKTWQWIVPVKEEDDEARNYLDN